MNKRLDLYDTKIIFDISHVNKKKFKKIAYSKKNTMAELLRKFIYDEINNYELNKIQKNLK